MTRAGGGPEIGVAIATAGRAAELERTLERLGSLPERPAIAVVDNGSGDGTSEMVRRRFQDVQLISLHEDAGPRARTAAVRTLGTSFVAFSDDDSWWAPGALERAVEVFERLPRLGLLAARVLVGGCNRLDPTCVAMRRSPLPPVPGTPYPSILGFIACGSVVRRSAYLAAGGFEDIGFTAEETLLAIDLAAAGWELAYVDDVIAHHHPSRDRNPRRRRVNERRNPALIAWLRRPLARALGDTVRLARSGARDRVAAEALIELLAMLPRLAGHRRPIPAAIERRLAALEQAQR